MSKMEAVHTQLTSRVFKLLNELPYNQRLVISISGPPGAGKTYTLLNLQKKINKMAHKRGFVEYNEDLCVVIPQELFRVRRPEMEKLMAEDLGSNEQLNYNLMKQFMMLRDVPKLYNSKYLLNLLNFLHQEIHELQTPTIYLSKDGSASDKDSSADMIKISSSCRVVIIEGSYVQLKDPVWSQIAQTVEERWFIRVKPQIAKRRLLTKYIEQGVVKSLPDLVKLWLDVDSIKRDYVITHTMMPDLIVDSFDQD